MNLIANKIDFKLASPEEICLMLALRLREHRLVNRWTQQELADRCGLDVGTIKNFEGKGQTSFRSFIRILVSLNLVDELAGAFELKALSIAEMEAIENVRRSKIPQRVRKPHRDKIK